MADGVQAESRERGVPSEPPPRSSLAAAHPHRVLWPWQVKYVDWKAAIIKLSREIADDRLTMVAGALAFYAMLALFPGLIALVSLFGLIADPKEIEGGLAQLADLLPGSAQDLLRSQLHELVDTPSSSLSLGFLISLVTALWSASSGVDALVDSINVAYNKIERRNWFRRRALIILLTLVLMLLTLIIISMVAILPSINSWLGDRILILGLFSALRWPVLAAVVAAGLFCLYRYAPCRTRPATSDMSGALIATVLFLVASSLFSLYVSEFASYHKTYGAVGSVVALLFWFYYSGLIILLGAELSAEFEGEKSREERAPT